MPSSPPPSASRSIVSFAPHALWMTLSPPTEVVMNHLTETKGQIGEDMRGRDHFEHGQLRDRRQSMRMQLERSRPCPRAFHGDIFKRVFDDLADARRTVDMRDDLEQEIGGSHGRTHDAQIGSVMLEAHRPRRDAHWPVVE